MTIKKIKSHCNRCLQLTNHEVLFSETVAWEDFDEPYFFMQGEDTFSLLKCLGCDDVRLRKASQNDHHNLPNGQPATRISLYPPSVTRKRAAWWYSYDEGSEKLRELSGIVDEIYSALAVGAHRLSLMGIRALTEKVMIDQVGDKNTFNSTIDAFFREGYVATKQQKLFKDTLIEAGHAAMHRSFNPNAENVETLLDIIEGVINTIYYQPVAASKVDEAIPKRA
jgi:hypothetical protein